jgi:hypothetical protein
MPSAHVDFDRRHRRMTSSADQYVGKVAVVTPVRPVVRDLTNPEIIEGIWAEADQAIRADRSRRSRRLRLRRTNGT